MVTFPIIISILCSANDEYSNISQLFIRRLSSYEQVFVKSKSFHWLVTTQLPSSFCYQQSVKQTTDTPIGYTSILPGEPGSASFPPNFSSPSYLVVVVVVE